jgi:hypothetical protein
MKSMPWFRMYAEAVDDEKLRLLACEDRWHFVALLCCKTKGILDEDSALLKRKVAVKLGLSTGELEEVARRLADVDLIDRETLQPLAWEHRQFQSDSSTERVKNYREKQRNAVKRFSNVSVTTQETETDTDTEVNQKNSRAPRFDGLRHLVSIGVDSSVASDWITTRKAKKAAVTLAAINGVEREAQKAGVSLADALAICCQRGWAGFKAEWVTDFKPAHKPTIHDERAFASAALTGKIPSNTTLKQFMEGQVSDVRLIEGVCHAA